MNWSAELVDDVAPPTVTVTSTTPAFALGDVAVHEVAEEHDTPVAAAEPKSTVVAPDDVENPVPVTVTVVPPAVEPDDGDTPVTVGAGTVKVNDTPFEDPEDVDTVTVSVPEPEGTVAVQDVDEHEDPDAGEPLNSTVPPERFEPDTVTELPACPDDGDTPATVGAGTV